MTGLSLILVLAPWIAFGALLAIVCALLLRSRRMSGHPPGRGFRPSSPNRQEERCPDTNAQASRP
jgi:hypothetical protein